MKTKSQVMISFAIALAITAAFFALTLVIEQYLYKKNVPGQIVRVEVVEKRTSRSSTKKGSVYHHYISFEFPDGEVREFAAGRPIKSESYDYINEGDTGILTYKGSRFESFEKDPDLGGLKIEPYRQGDIDEFSSIKKGLIFVFFLFWGIFFVGFRSSALQRKVKKAYEQIEDIEQKGEARLLEKGKCPVRRNGSSVEILYAIFELENNVRYTVTFAASNAPAHKALQENDIGLLTCKETPGEFYSFISFERIENRPPSPHSANRPLYQHSADMKQKSKFTLESFAITLYIIGLFSFIILSVIFQLNENLVMLGIFIYLSFLLIWSRKERKILIEIPEQEVKATVIKKDKHLIITFSLSNGETKEIPVSSYEYITIITGDRGLLTFKEHKRAAHFISFVRSEVK